MKKLAQLKADAKREGWAKWIRSEADERAVLNDIAAFVASKRKGG